MSGIHQGDPKKLPKWAQDELRRLKRELENANDRYDQAIRNPPSNTFVDSAGWEKRPVRYLPNDSRVRYRLGDGNPRGDWIDVRVTRGGHHGPYVEVMAATGLVILAHATNVIHLRLEQP